MSFEKTVHHSKKHGNSFQTFSEEATGLRIEPAVIKFLKTYSGEPVKKKLFFQNLTTKLMRVGISKPYSFSFQLKDSGVITLGPGMCTVKTLIFSNNEDIVSSKLPIRVDNRKYFIPITVANIKPNLTISPLFLDFGLLNIGEFSKRNITIKNTGECTAKFCIDFRSTELIMMAEPKVGRSPPGTSTNVTIRAVGAEPGEFYKEFWVTSEPSVRILVSASTVVPSLKILHPNYNENLTIIDFNSTYINTCIYESFLVYNCSTDSSTFVVLAHHENQLQPLNLIKSRCSSLDWFDIMPNEGKLLPFEARNFCARFSPTPLRTPNGEKVENYWTFIQVKHVDVSSSDFETYEVKDSSHSKEIVDSATKGFYKTSTNDVSMKNEIICFFGKSEEADVLLEPDAINCTIKLGESVKKSLKITNISSALEIQYEYVKIPHIELLPPKKLIPPGGFIEVDVIVRAKSIAVKQPQFSINLNYYRNMNVKNKTVVLKKKVVPLNINLVPENTKIQPIFNPGISPKIGGALVGLNTDKVSFDIDSKIFPKATLISTAKKYLDKPWFHKSIIAFPNDRTSRFTVLPVDKNKRTIFTGIPRYLPPPDKNVTFSPSELRLKKELNKGYNKCIEYNKKKLKKKPIIEEYDVDELPEERQFCMLKFKKPLTESERTDEVDFSLKDIAPLTPTQLYNVHISPEDLDFGNIPIRFNCCLVIKVLNKNSFPITVKFIHNNDYRIGLSILNVKPFCVEHTEVFLLLKTMGMFYSNIIYIINGHYKFNKQIKANGVSCSLSIKPNVLNFQQKKMNYFAVNRNIVNIYNSFTVSISFEWKNYLNTPVEIYPERGCIFAKSSISCMIYLPRVGRVSQTMKIHLLIDGGRAEDVVSMVVGPYLAIHGVVLVTPNLTVGNLPVGTRIIKELCLFNHSYVKSKYSVVNTNPVAGVQVFPKTGEVGAKSIENISVSFYFDYVANLNFQILIDIENEYVLKIPVRGCVVFPKVEYIPKELNFNQTKQYSFGTAKLTVYNRSEAQVNVQFLIKEFYHFKVSTSENYLDPGVKSEGITLKKGGRKAIYVHFEPGEIVSYAFYLPILINGLLGPPEMDNPDTLSPSYFLKVSSERGKALNKPLSLPDSYDTVKVDCIVEGCEIMISNMFLSFFSFDIGERSVQYLTIKNPLNHSNCFAFGLPEGSDDFLITPLDASESSIFFLPPRESIVFQISFTPKRYGSFYVDVPLYLVKKQMVLYNHIELNGLCYQPTLFCETPEVYFIPVPLNTSIERVIVIQASYQNKDTQMTVDIIPYKLFDGIVSHTFVETSEIKKNSSSINIPISIRFESKENVSTKVKLLFKDGLGGSCLVYAYVTAYKSYLLTHIYHFFYVYNSEISYEETADDTSCVFSDDSSVKRTSLKCEVKTEINEAHLDESICSHESIMTSESFDEELWFPEFPSLNVETEYSAYMKKVLKYATKWAGFQGFNGYFVPKIGEETFSTSNLKEAIKGEHHLGKNIVDFVVALFGDNLKRRESFFSEVGHLSTVEDDIKRIRAYLKTFKNILDFLTAQGNGLAYISPKYFLNYDDYVFFQAHLDKILDKISDPSEEDFPVKNRETFKRISKQFWVDLYIQLYKTHTLDFALNDSLLKFDSSIYSLKFQNPLELNMNFTRLPKENEEMPLNLLKEYEGPYSPGEQYLLAWLTKTYKMAEGTLSGIPPLTEKLNFGDTLRDSYVLAVVTTYYCEYMMETYLQRMYYKPVNEEQHKHNANNFVVALDQMHVGFSLKPHDMVNANPIFMIMLASYLYFALPFYKPQYQLRLKASLGSSINQTINIKNPNDKPVKYYVTIIQSENKPFSISPNEEYYKIGASEKLTLLISYMAKKVTKSTGVLLLSGSVFPGVQGVTISIKIIGEPIKLEVANRFIIHLPLYKVIYTNLMIKPPYRNSCTYEVHLSHTKPTGDEGFKTDCTLMKGCKLPLEIFLSSGLLQYDENKPKTELSVALCRFYNEKMSYWLLFSNKLIGDFIVEIILIPYTIEPRTVLTVTYNVVKEHEWIPAHSSIVHLLIPSKNSPMWNAAKIMMNLSLDSNHSLWTSKLCDPIGLTLLEFEVRTKCPCMIPFLKGFLKKTVTFDIEFTSPMIKLTSSEITMKDVHSDQFESIKVIVEKNASTPFTAYLTLTSKDTSEVRTYQVNFQPKNENDSSIKNS